MLWYKVWLETRARFLICLVAISGFCGFAVSHEFGLANASTPSEFYYGTAHSGHGLLAGLWVAAVNFLMMGGLVREKASGASSLTLALPFSRARLVATRAALGLIEAAALVVLPSAAMWAQVDMAGKHYPVSQIWFHFVLMLSGGLVFLAIAFLASSVIEGEYTAPLISFSFAPGIAFAMRDLPAWSPARFMGAGDYFNTQTGLVSGPVPWAHAGAYVLVAAVLLGASVKAIQVREF